MPEKLIMTREAFVKQLHDDVDLFSKWWADAVKRGDVPIEYTMDEADWFEQFMMFCDDDGVKVY